MTNTLRTPVPPSPKALFQAPSIMLMQYLPGSPIRHHSAGQRALLPADYHALGVCVCVYML